MPKRRRVSNDSDAYAIPSDGSEDAEFVPTRSRPTHRSNKPRHPRTSICSNVHEGAESRLHSASDHTLTTQEAEPVRDALEKWYARVHAVRGMPWRKAFDASWNEEEKAQRAYEVWVSEIMLQQTQVATVIPYYNRWMEKYPTIRDLAQSDIETVNSLWKGLGYYSRAARLLAGAQKVAASPRYQGKLPPTAKELEAEVPGVGRYSAGAISSIAYNERAPVLDGNVNRLLSRVLALHSPPKSKATLDLLWAGAEALVARSEKPGELNQALIELGSTICTPRSPKCTACPISSFCRAYRLHQGSASKVEEVIDIEDACSFCEPLGASTAEGVEAYPMKVEKKKARAETDLVHVIEWRSVDEESEKAQRWFLLVRRPDGGLLGGLHEFPTTPNVDPSSKASSESAHASLSALLSCPPAKSRSADDASELRVATIKPVADVLHVFSHIRKTYRPSWVLLQGGGSEPPDLKVGSSTPPAAKPVKRGRRRASGTDFSHDTAGCGELVNARWVALNEIADANIGTGVVKIWREVQKCW